MSKFFIIRKVLPGIINARYDDKYQNADHNFFKRFFCKLKCAFWIILSSFRLSDIKDRINDLETKFESVRQISASQEKTKPICVYIVDGKNDHNGAIVSNVLKYYHLYKIKELQKQYRVFPCCASELGDLQKKLQEYSSAGKITLIDIVAHGEYNCIGNLFKIQGNLKLNSIESNTQIILDSCSTASRTENICKKLSEDNDNIDVFGAEVPLFCSNPKITIKDEQPRVENVAHGFCVMNPYWMTKVCQNTEAHVPTI